MKTSAKRTSTTVSRSFRRASSHFFAPVQAKMKVNAPGDKHEKEAESTADRVMRMPEKGADLEKESVQKAEAPKNEEQVQKAEAQEEDVQKADAPDKEEVQKAEAEEEEQVQKAEASQEEEVVQKAVEEQPIQKSEAPKDEEQVQKAAAEEEEVQKAEAEQEEEVQKAEGEEEEEAVQRFTNGTPTVTDSVQTGIRSEKTGGQRMDSRTRSFMESRFNADFGGVRIHTNEKSARLSNRLGARAFTTGNHIFFARNQYQPGSSDGKHLLAHELTHTIQQGASVQRSPQVTTTATPPPIQRLGVSDALDYFADKANFIPGFRMLTVILGFNPINMSSVDRSAGNILRAVIELIPLGVLITQALENHGVFQRAGEWVSQQFEQFRNIGAEIRQALDDFLDSLSWSDIFDLGGVWARGKAIFTSPIKRLISFGKGLVSGLMDLVRDAILRPLAEMAKGTRGYPLLCAVLGVDLITGDAVPRNAETLIGGFMKLIGREDIWENIQKGNAIARAWAWFQGALSGVMALVTGIPQQIMATLRSITWQDIITIVGVFGKISGLFISIVGQVSSWAFGTIFQLLEIIFDVVAPGVMPYIRKAQGAFRSILENPIGFVGNLVRAGKLGFQMFGKNIVKHLRTALVKWITGPLGDAGVYIPQSFSLVEIIKLVLSVLGLTWDNIRTKLLKILPEPVLVVLEKSASVLVTLVTEGPAAAWEQIKAELSELKATLIAEVTKMVSTEIVKAAVFKVASMLNPAGAVIQAILSIYNTIMFFVERMSQIAATVGAFVNSVAAIAAGQVQSAAAKVEQTMARTLVVVISFLARFAGIGGIPNKIVGIINRIRKPIDKGLDRIVGWLGKMLKKVIGGIKNAIKGALTWWTKKRPVSGGGESHTLKFQGQKSAAKLVVQSSPQKPSLFLSNKAKEKNIEDAKSKPKVDTVVGMEVEVDGLQKKLAVYDDVNTDPPKALPDKTQEKEANKLSGDLDTKLGAMSTFIGSTLEEWGAADAVVDNVNVLPLKFDKKLQAMKPKRPSFRTSTKKALNLAQPDLAGNSATSVAEGMDRRHIVSSKDMADHYKAEITGKKVSEAKILLEQRGSAPGALTPVAKDTPAGVEKSTQKRHKNFFNYTRNLFIGDSSENRSIQEKLDAGKPGMAEAELRSHVGHVKRLWALSGGFAPSE